MPVLPRSIKIGLVERNRASRELALSTQALLLDVSRSSLYYRPVAVSQQEVELKHKIDEVFTAHPYYGSRRITHQLRREGLVVNRKAIQGHMREMGLEAIAPGPNLSKRNLAHRVFPYLLRGVEAAHCNHIFGIDITYIRLKKSWMYLVAVLDWYSRYVVSWELDQTLEIEFVIEAVQRALKQAVPVIFNSDQGSHTPKGRTSPQYTELVLASGAKVTPRRGVDGKGRALDNIFTERLWRTIKYEDVFIQDYTTPKEVQLGLGKYLQFYNEGRIHQSLDYRTPAEVYFEIKEARQSS